MAARGIRFIGGIGQSRKWESPLTRLLKVWTRIALMATDRKERSGDGWSMWGCACSPNFGWAYLIPPARPPWGRPLRRAVCRARWEIRRPFCNSRRDSRGDHRAISSRMAARARQCPHRHGVSRRTLGRSAAVASHGVERPILDGTRAAVRSARSRRHPPRGHTRRAHTSVARNGCQTRMTAAPTSHPS